MAEKDIDNRSWVERHRMLSVSIVMLLVWVSLLAFFWIEAEAITKDPCSICAARQGEDIMCTIGGIEPLTKTYYPNMSVSVTDP